MQLKKLTSIIQYVLLGISLAAFIITLVNWEVGVDLMLYWAYILLGLAVGATVILSAVNIAKNPKGARRSLYGLAVVAVVIIISYFLSNSAAITLPDQTVYDNKFGLIISDIGIITSYIALAAAILVAIVGEIKNSIR